MIISDYRSKVKRVQVRLGERSPVKLLHEACMNNTEKPSGKVIRDKHELYIRFGIVYYKHMPKKRRIRNHSKKQGILRTILVLYLALAAIFVLTPIASKIVKIFNPPCANSISCIKDLSGRLEPDTEGVFLGKKIAVPGFLASIPSKKQVLGTTFGPKHISVDLSKQRLYAHEGDKLVYKFPVSTGKWGRTPTGEYKIWIKLLRTRMSGGSGNDYYNLPNVPYTMFFYNDQVSKSRGFALHGAYWHNNFGFPMSHGCVNIRPEDARKLFEWVEPVSKGNVTHATNESPGTTITIYGETPS